MDPSLATVFDPAFLRKLDRLRLNVRHTLATRTGNTLMPRGSQPSGMELSRHKTYAPGDDLRHLDWNAFGRLDQLLVKTFRAEREVPLHILLDCSASMEQPRDDAKLAFAKAIAASLAYVALSQHDPVQIVCLGGGTELFQASPRFQHPQRLPEVRTLLAGIEARGSTRLVDGIDGYLRTVRVPGIAVLLSDFLVPAPMYATALAQLRASHSRTTALRLMGPHERNPPPTLPPRIRLRDVETGAERVVRLTPSHRAAYAAAWDAHLAGLQDWADAHDVAFVAVNTQQGVESCLFADLARVGLLY